MKFTQKAVEIIEKVTGQTLTAADIKKGSMEFTIKSNWSWMPEAIGTIDRDDWGNYKIIRKIPEYGRVAMANGVDFYKTADTNDRLNKRLHELMNY